MVTTSSTDIASAHSSAVAIDAPRVAVMVVSSIQLFDFETEIRRCGELLPKLVWREIAAFALGVRTVEHDYPVVHTERLCRIRSGSRLPETDVLLHMDNTGVRYSAESTGSEMPALA